MWSDGATDIAPRDYLKADFSDKYYRCRDTPYPDCDVNCWFNWWLLICFARQACAASAPT
jgi:hypothetical protein